MFACEMIRKDTVVTWYDGIAVPSTDRVEYLSVDRLGLRSHKMRNNASWAACQHTLDGKGVTPLDIGCGAFQFMNSSFPEDGNIKVKIVGGEKHPLGTSASVMVAVAARDIECKEELVLKYVYKCFDKVKLVEILGLSV